MGTKAIFEYIGTIACVFMDDVGVAIQHNPYSHFACLNSGSEATALALRVSTTGIDKPYTFIALKDGFHGILKHG